MAIDFGRRFARVRTGLGAVVILMSWLSVTPAGAQVSPAGFPASFYDVNAGASGPYPYNTPYGAAFPFQGSFGVGTSSFDGFGNLALTRQDVNSLHAGFTNVTPTTGVINQGQLEFTTVNPTTLYTIDGIIPLNVSTGPGASASVNCMLTLEQIGGPTLATYSVAQSFPSGPPFSLIVFDASSPVSGLQSGSLLPATSYRLKWFWQVSMTHNGSALSDIDIAPSSPSYFQISFVPEPSFATIMLLLGTAAFRRRR